MTVNWKKILAVVGGLVVLVGVAYLVWWLKSNLIVDYVPQGIHNGTSTLAVDTSEWKTYRNEDFGFEIKLPKEYDDYKVSEATSFDDGPGKGLQGEITNFIFSVDARGTNWPNDIFSIFMISVYDLEWWSENAHFPSGSKDAEWKYGERDLLGTYLGKNSNMVFTFQRSAQDCPGSVGGNDYNTVHCSLLHKADQVMRTFKFIEPVVDTSGWKTYRNEKQGYEIKYPQEWSVYSDITSESFPGFDYRYEVSNFSSII